MKLRARVLLTGWLLGMAAIGRAGDLAPVFSVIWQSAEAILVEGLCGHCAGSGACYRVDGKTSCQSCSAERWQIRHCSMCQGRGRVLQMLALPAPQPR
jgi:hypothetical protein